jgi:tetratricopeptide (TPR) repeat protein
LDDSQSHQAKGNSDQAQRKSEKGEELLNQLLKLSLSVSGEEEQINSRDIRHRLANVFVSQGRYDKAEEQFEAMLAIQRRIPGGSDIAAFRLAISAIGWTRLRQQKYVEAEKGLREVMPFFDSTRVDALPRYVWESTLGASLVGQRKYEEAEARLLEGYDGIRRTEPLVGPRAANDPARFRLGEVGEWIVRLYQEWGEPDKAAEWQAKIQADKASAPSPRR